MGRVKTGFGRFIEKPGVDLLEGVIERAEAASRLIRPVPVMNAPSKGHAVVLGCGRMGSRVAFDLARCNVSLTLVDRDVVEPHNLAAGNSLFRERDLGKPKSAALKDILGEYAPKVHVDELQADVTLMSQEELRARAEGAGLALGLLDEGEGLFRINDTLYRHLPVVYAAGHHGARTGDVSVSRPGGACFRCILNISSSAEIQTLAGEKTHGVDIAAIADACTRVALVLLGDPELGDVREVLDPAVNFIFLENRRSPTSPRGFAPQFLRIERRRTCTVCGVF